MKQSTTAIIVPVAVGLALCGSAYGNTTDTGTEALRAEVAALKAQVARLSADENWLTEQRADEIRGLVQDVLADADTRASLLQNGMTAGYDSGFFLASSDGNFKLKINGTLQVRFVFNSQDDSTDGADGSRWGFENRRTRLRFGGHVVDPSWGYFIQGDFGTAGNFALLDAYIKKSFDNGWYALGGKFILPFSREILVSHAKPLLVERSIAHNYFAVGRAQGAMVGYKDEQFKFDVAYHDGMGSMGGTTAGALTYDTEYAFTARAEYLAAGEWAQFGDFTSWSGEEFGFLLGAAVHWESDEYGTGDGLLVDVDENGIDDNAPINTEAEAFRWTIDGMFEFGGANLYAAIFGNHTSADSTDDVDQYGFVLHGGFFLNDDWELFGRYEWADEDAEIADDLSIFTIGVNRYFSKHQVKWTTDIGYGFNEVTGTFASAGAGWRADSENEDGQMVFRTQLQLLF